MATKETLRADTHELAEQIPPLINSIKATTEAPQDTSNQVELMYVAEVFLHVSFINFFQMCSIQGVS